MKAAANVDEGLSCPFCGYNLTGLPGDVCPECGRGFSRSALRLARHDRIPIWDDRREIGYVRAFLGTVWFMWRHPVAFARGFPRRPSRQSAMRFGYACYAIAGAIPFITVTSLRRSAMLGVGATISVFLMGSRIFEDQYFWSIVYSQGGELTPRHHTKRMRGAFVRFTSAYLLLPSLAFSALFAVTEVGKLSWPDPVVIVIMLGLLAAYLFWWIELVMLTGGLRGRRCAFVVAFLVPVFAVLSAILAVTIAYVFASS